VNHPERGQAIAPGDLGVARLAASQAPALFEQPRPGGTMDRSVDTAAAQKGAVGGVNDAVGL